MLRPLLLCLLCAPVLAADFVWWEAENPAQTTFPKTSDFSPQTFADRRDQLSAGDWLSASGKAGKEPLCARYRVQVPKAADYHLWARKFWKHGPFTWRFDDRPWQTCGRDVALTDDVALRTFVNANWVYLGDVTLAAGPHDFELKLLANEGEDAPAAFDCFLLTPGLFLPNGRLKPGEKSNLATEGFFPWEPPLDDFRSGAALDLRRLNETSAGQSGFVQRDGKNFALGDGSPVRFWAVNVSSNNAGQSHQTIDYMARKLAKLGVNMVRYHSPLFDSPAPTATNPRKLDDLHYLVAALKQQGIYTTISFYFPLWVDLKKHPDFPGFDALDNKHPFALLYFDEKFQALHRAWLKEILTADNPYTHVPLAKDPAVAVVEIVNEDSLFFWTLTRKNVPAPQWEALEREFARWLTQRYGSLGNAYTAWGKAKLKEDAADRPAILEAWGMTRDGIKQGGPDRARRVSDQVRFFTDLQRGFYERTIQYIRRDLGGRSLIACSNWTVSDPVLLDALERYTYTAGDVIDAHGYVQPKNEGPGAGWSVRDGHTFENLAVVQHPDKLPILLHQVDGYPQTITELGWTQPNRFRADATFLCAAYGALQGIDGVYWFILDNDFVRATTIGKFNLAGPVIAGTFPAAALQYRRGDVTEAPPSVYQALSLDDLFALKGSASATATALDDLRKRDLPPGALVKGTVGTMHPLSPLAGPVFRAFDKPSSDSYQRDLSKYIDEPNKTVTSLTGQLKWDFGRGLATVNTPRSQGAAGFLAQAGRIELSDVTIDCRNDYAAIWVIALDDHPLATSRKILVQAMTEDQPYGWKVDGNKIISIGSPPFGVRKIQATVTLKAPALATAQTLDENGYPTAAPVEIRSGQLTLPPAATHCLITRDSPPRQPQSAPYNTQQK